MAAAYSVGIDLGTTHTVVAYAPAKGRVGDATIKLLAIDQLVAAGEVAARPLLPSLRYHPAEGELAAADRVLPWGVPAHGAVIGELARQLGARVPGRLVTSAKSWLSHAAVDRQADILPWGAAAGVPQVSPVTASAGTLAHLRAAWNHHHPQAPLQAQEIVLTVPASFDDAARALTLAAARDAGLPSLRLLEEPQAALYDWLFRHRGRLAAELLGTRLVLVCDVGGGTTDLSLVRVDVAGGEPVLQRIAVGQHLMLGGDNMDLALAHLAERRLIEGGAQRLAPAAFAQLVERCRAAKETLLADAAPERAPVTLLGAGARLVGSARTVELTRDEVARIVVDGFFPLCGADEAPQPARRSAGLVGFGLPYAADPAVTRHVAGFLRRHADAGAPDALLLNGGVFHAAALAGRLQAVLANWRGAPLKVLANADPDVAVARGAVAYALARRGLAPRIGGGSARSYLLPIADAGEGGGATRAVCLLPRGSEEGHELALADRLFALRVGEPVRFHLVAATAGGMPAGAVVELATIETTPLPPLATVIDGGQGDGRREVAVRLASTLTEVGTLDLQCIAADDPARRWQLAFQLRRDAAPTAPVGLPPRFADALAAIDRVFGARDRRADPKAVKQLRAQLDAVLGDRDRWPLPVLRALADALLPLARARRRSADHERLWLSLVGWCLRPGFGEALDGWRIDQLWPLYEPGVQHGDDPRVAAEWWTLWRRVAGGLADAAQQRLLEDFVFNLRGGELDADARAQRPPRLVKGGWDDMVRIVGSLERLPADHKAEVGEWLLAQALKPGTTPPAAWTLWAIGRLGARVPFHGSVHGVVPAQTASPWLEALLALDWKRCDGAAAAAANLARVSGDRARDLAPDLRDRVTHRLLAAGAPAGWIERVREFVPLDEAGERAVFGEALPLGLTLIG